MTKTLTPTLSRRTDGVPGEGGKRDGDKPDFCALFVMKSAQIIIGGPIVT
jgi:hypothetical protein